MLGFCFVMGLQRSGSPRAGQYGIEQPGLGGRSPSMC
jgi:hypothetical protein